MEDKKTRFTYGDRIRRRSGGEVRTVADIGADTYDFADGGFALIADQDCYELVEKASGFFRVVSSLGGAPLADHLHYGYELRADFRDALRRLLDRWAGRTGERVDQRHGHLLLRFHDTPGGRPDEAWLPLYLLEPVPVPEYMLVPERDELAEELDKAFGFD